MTYDLRNDLDEYTYDRYLLNLTVFVFLDIGHLHDEQYRSLVAIPGLPTLEASFLMGQTRI